MFMEAAHNSVRCVDINGVSRTCQNCRNQTLENTAAYRLILHTLSSTTAGHVNWGAGEPYKCPIIPYSRPVEEKDGSCNLDKKKNAGWETVDINYIKMVEAFNMVLRLSSE
jgi:hypothetical protein